MVVEAEAKPERIAKSIRDPQSRAAKLKLTDDEPPATLAELGDLRRELSKNERLKLPHQAHHRR